MTVCTNVCNMVTLAFLFDAFFKLGIPVFKGTDIILEKFFNPCAHIGINIGKKTQYIKDALQIIMCSLSWIIKKNFLHIFMAQAAERFCENVFF